MAEPKYRYRIPPCPACDIPAMESWLEDMAAKGLHLAPDGFFWGAVTFEEGPPAKVRYRLEATATQKGLFSNEYEPDDDAVQLHRQMGWTYRARRDQFHIYVSSDPNAPELNTDPQVQALSIAALSKYLRSSLRSALLLFAIYAVFRFGDILLTTAVTMGSGLVGLLVLLLLWDLLRRIRELVVLSRYKKHLENGEPLPHRSGYGWRYPAFSLARKVLWVVLFVSFLAVAGQGITEENYVPLDDQSLPFATVGDLYPGSEVKRMNGILDSEFYRWSDLLAPENYDFSEYAEVTLDGKTFDCYLSITYHRTRWEWTARQLAKELVSQSGANVADQTLAKLFGDEIISPTVLDLPEADYAVWYYARVADPYLVIQKDNIVIRVRYAPFSGAPGIKPEELAALVLSHLR